MPGAPPSHNVSGPWSQLTKLTMSNDLAPIVAILPSPALRSGLFLSKGNRRCVSGKALAVEALGEGLCIFRLGKAEHHKVVVVAAEVIRPRGDRQSIRETAHSLIVLDVAYFVSGERNVVRPFAHDIGARELAFAACHRYRTAISFVAGRVRSADAFSIASSASAASTVPIKTAFEGRDSVRHTGNKRRKTNHGYMGALRGDARAPVARLR